MVLVAGKHLVHIQGQHIAHRHLFEQTGGKQTQRLATYRGAEPPGRFQLGQQLASPADGTRGDGGEKAGEQKVVEQILFRGNIPPVDVDEVADGGEGIKADAQGKGQFDQSGGSQQHRQHCVAVFEHRQKAQTPRHTQGHPGLFAAAVGHAQGQKIGEEGHRSQGCQRHQPLGAVGEVDPEKHQAGRRQNQVLPPGGEQIIAHRRHRQQSEIAKG